jgi:hypothetical protein
MWMDVLLNAFLGIMHVNNTIVLPFKEAIEALFAKHWLSISHLYKAMMKLVTCKVNLMTWKLS